jgi:uncharacterized protein YpmS
MGTRLAVVEAMGVPIHLVVGIMVLMEELVELVEILNSEQVVMVGLEEMQVVEV